MHYLTRGPLALLSALLLTACAHSSAPVPAFPPPCASNDSVYVPTRMQATTGFVPPRPLQVFLPPDEFHGTARVSVLVDAHGQVTPDSTRVEGG